METKKEVKTYIKDYTCDTCQEGAMRSTGETLMSDPPQYPHTCTKCGIKMILRLSYPHVCTE